MRKDALTPLYVSVAWTLMISYQLFTQKAVATVVTSINRYWPSATSAWLVSRIETIVFVHAFAWVFVLSSVIPSLLLQRRGSVLIQFFVCLTLTLGSIWVRDTLPVITESQIVDQIFTLAGLFNDPFVASLFLLAPYLLMLSLDIYSREESPEDRGKEKADQEAETVSPEDTKPDLPSS